MGSHHVGCKRESACERQRGPVVCALFAARPCECDSDSKARAYLWWLIVASMVASMVACLLLSCPDTVRMYPDVSGCIR
eukprot:317946-Prymnesium_polylepis.1